MGRMEQVASQNVKQIQRLILSPQMQQALHLLQLPVLELNTMIEEELVQNPLLERGEEEEMPLEIREIEKKQGGHTGEDIRSFIENTVAYEKSLFDYLVEQARETFQVPYEFEIAKWIIGNLDTDGLITTPVEEIAALGGYETDELLSVIEAIQAFDPPGVCARNCKESLLIQLRRIGKEATLAFRIIDKHYDDVIHNRIPAIAKSLSRSMQEVRSVLEKEISCLDLHPGTNRNSGHYRQVIQHITPDLIISYEEKQFSIKINNEKIPYLRFNPYYLNMLADASLSGETREYIADKMASGKWLMRNLHERNQTLYRIAQELVRTQSAFFSHPTGELIPMTMKELAVTLELHESTIARAVAHKYISCSKGTFLLRAFFTHAYTTDQGTNISAQTVKGLLKNILLDEDKRHPLSDEAISVMIKKQGIACARRTIAKYRGELQIGNTAQRRIHTNCKK